MCGFSGFLSINKEDQKVIESMASSLHHRGPNNIGYKSSSFSNMNLEIAHNRLSILDLEERSNQPFNCGEFELLYNGEIYNFKEIKEELISESILFETEGDTEVVIKSIIHYGLEQALSKFRGMFSIVLIHQRSETIYLIRDRVGVKPLYYHIKENILIFGSELKALSHHPRFSKIISPEALRNYFNYGFVTGRQSIFEDCFRVLPGEIVTIKLSQSKLSYERKKYWEIEDFFKKPKLKISYDEAKEKLKSLLKESFKLRMVSDVPVGVFLSSGYDSTCVASLLTKDFKNLNTFTIGFHDKKENEAHIAKEIAAKLNTNHHETYCNEEDAIKLASKLVDFYDEPFGDSSAIPTILVSNFAKEKVTVSLSADGGDELFYGYSRYFTINSIKNNKLINNPLTRYLLIFISFFSPLIEKLFKVYNLTTRIKKIISIIEKVNYYETLDTIIKIFPDNEVDDLITINTPKIIKATNLNQTSYYKNGMQLWDATHYLPDDILVKVDRATMSTSLEGREPFLDHKIIEFAAQLPQSFLEQNNSGKKIIKDIVHDYIPKDLIDRPKTGFSVPLTDWLKGPLKSMVTSALTSLNSKDFPEINLNEANKIYESFYKSPEAHNPHKLWLLINYIQWKNKWVL
ncbi:MAG: asparagine synthase (glutamine-hydrolyzing) [Oligoflexia bacterium]|nr:asparagine synthase (glutamine-hydrolyzing) [Oligoflexia bacterium]